MRKNLTPPEKRPLPNKTPTSGKCHALGMDAPEQLPLPDLYLIDSGRLIKEIERIRGLVLQVPFSETTHTQTQTVIDALWHLQRDLQEILHLQATMQRSFGQKAEALKQASQPPVVALRALS
jgi:hypothetical protein